MNTEKHPERDRRGDTPPGPENQAHRDLGAGSLSRGDKEVVSTH